MQASSFAMTIGAVLQELRMQQETVENNLASEQRTIEANKKTIAQLKTDISALERATGDLATAQANAQKAGGDAQRTWDAVKDQLDELDRDVKQEIGTAIGAADKALGEKQSDIDRRREELDKLKDELAQFERELKKREAGFRSAIGWLQQLPVKIGSAIAALQKIQSDLKTAADSGQARKVFVLATELQRIGGDLDTWRKPDYEQQLTERYEKARTAMEEQRGLVQQKQQTADARQLELSKGEIELAKLTADREKLIKELFVPHDQAPAARAVGKA